MHRAFTAVQPRGSQPAACQPAARQTRMRAPAAPRRHTQCTASSAEQQPLQGQPQPQQPQALAAPLARRTLLAAPLGLAALLQLPRSAAAFVEPPPGYRYHQDKLDGYSFFYPEDWSPVTTSGNDVFYRNPFNIEENLFVDVSSPSSSKYNSVEDLGTPEQAAQRTLDQYLDEFMSTRLGVRRTAEIVSARSRTGSDGRLYYEVQARVKSYASRDQLAVTQKEVDAAVELEWDRRYFAVLGVANKRLYQLRIQAANSAFEKENERLDTIARSFALRDV